MSNIYKYRVGKKWYTFDKSILDPQDVRVFDLANWSDKLKIITIYQDLKPHDDDDVIILKTKKENPNKDKRAAEYRAKRQKLESDLVEANRTNNEGEQARLIKQLNDLDIQYADIINIQNTETVNIAKANQVILNNVDELIKQTNTKLDQLRTSLTQADFNTIKNNIEALLEANNKIQIDDSITAINDKLEELTHSTLIPSVQNGVNTILSTINKLKESLDNIEEMETVNKLIEYGFFGEIKPEQTPYLEIMSMVLSQLDKSGISQEDLTTLSDYPYAVEFLSGQRNPLKLIHPFCELIRMFEKLEQLWIQDPRPQIGFHPNESDRKMKISPKYKIEGDKGLAEFIDKIEIFGNGNKYDLFVKYPKHNPTFVGTYDFKITDNKQGTYKVLMDVIKSFQVDEGNKTGAVEQQAQGFLGLKTSKSAKQDYEELKREITTLKKQIDEMAIEINNLRNTKVSITEPDTPEPEPAIIQDSQRPTTVPSFLTDLNKRKDQLKHAEPIQKQPELTDLQKLLNRRRQDIAPDEYEEEEEEDWGEGLGGILGELQRDLNKYGLVLSLSPDGKAYFVNVYNKKGQKQGNKVPSGSRQGNGVVEANTLVNSVNENTEYKDLKKLYESLY